MSNQNDANVFEQINEIGAQFRRAWRNGDRPRIEDWLGRVAENARSNLFSSLLQHEIIIRQKAGERPTSGDYSDRFPDYGQLIRSALDESTMGSFEGLEENSKVESSESLTQWSGGTLSKKLGDYELVKELGRGGFGIVYEARHIKRGNRVALKTLPTGQDVQGINADRLHKFRQEFRSLSEINHPNLVGMQTLEVDGDQWFFTMDLIEGTDFLSYVRPEGELDETRLRETLRQLVTGIATLHERRIIHCDLKPSNVMVDGTGRVIVLDFGLIVEIKQSTDATASMRTRHFAGTPVYAAPEQVFGTRTSASDWYAFGTMLYESLTGNRPFSGSSTDVLVLKRERAAPKLSGKENMPADLAILADQLLKRDPDERPAVAAIASSLSLNLQPLSQGSESSAVDIDSGQIKEEFDLIGREEQLNQLELAWQNLLETRKPVVVWITGKSGEGKSSLAEKFMRSSPGSGETLVLSGRCYDRESVPFKAIDSIVDSLVRFLNSQSGRKFQSDLPDDIAILARLFPLLNRVEAIANCSIATHIAPEKVRARGLFALRKLLGNISSQMPVVIFIDDLQWGDADSAKAFGEMINSNDQPALMFLGSYRSDEASDSPFLRVWHELVVPQSQNVIQQQVAVDPLSRQQSIELAALRTGLGVDRISEQADAIYAESGGNPYFIESLTAGFNQATGEFAHAPLAQIIELKLEKLPPLATKLLEVVAVSGQPIIVDEACEVLDLGTAEMGILTHMRSERLVRLVDDEKDVLVETYHDKIRETVLDTISKELQRTLHLKLAEGVESKEQMTAQQWMDSVGGHSTPGIYDQPMSTRVVDMAHHFSEANDSRAFIYLLLAAEQAMQGYAVEDGVGLYEEVLKRLPHDSPASLRYRVALGAGRVFQWSKDEHAALEAYRSAVEAASNSAEGARAHNGLAGVHVQKCRFDEAIKQMDMGLSQLGVKRPRTTVGKLAYFFTKSLSLILSPAKWHEAWSDTKKDHAVIVHELLMQTAFTPLFEKDFVAGLSCQALAAKAALSTGQPLKIAWGYSALAQVWARIGGSWISKILLRRFDKITSSLEDAELAGDFYYLRGLAAYYGGDLASADSLFTSARELLIRSHSLYLVPLCTHMHRHVKTYVGTSQEELTKSQTVLELARQTGNQQGLCLGYYDIAGALARKGELKESVYHMQQSNSLLKGERFLFAEAIRASSDAFVRIQCSDYKVAHQCASSAWRIITSGWAFIDPSLYCVPLMTEGILGPNWLEGGSSGDRKLLKKSLWRARVMYRIIPNHQPHLLRVAGRASCALGNHRKAIRKFKKAVELAEKKGMDYQHAKSLLDLAAVQEEGRDENRAEAIELLKKMESVIPRAESWLLGDQFDEAVVAPEFDLAEWEKENGPVTPNLKNQK